MKFFLKKMGNKIVPFAHVNSTPWTKEEIKYYVPTGMAFDVEMIILRLLIV